jgi:hypothetical protein
LESSLDLLEAAPTFDDSLEDLDGWPLTAELVECQRGFISDDVTGYISEVPVSTGLGDAAYPII